MTTRSMIFFVAVAVPALALTASAGRAQSLGDAAQREREKRARKHAPAHVYGNEDLPSPVDSAGARSPGNDGTGAADPATNGGTVTAEPGAAGEPVEDTAPTELSRKEAEWRHRAAPLRSDLEVAEARVTQLEAEVEQLERQRLPMFPLQDFQVAQALAEARQNLEASRAARTAARKAWDDLEEDARRAGAYPGWLR